MVREAADGIEWVRVRVRVRVVREAADGIEGVAKAGGARGEHVDRLWGDRLPIGAPWLPIHLARVRVRVRVVRVRVRVVRVRVRVRRGRLAIGAP